MSDTIKTHKGSCHCGAVKFEVDIPVNEASQGTRCNCSACTKFSTLAKGTKPDALRLIAGEEHLSTYEWGAKIGKRYFCKHCGVHCFMRGHLAEMGGDFASVNMNALDDVDPGLVRVTYWDGRHNNWEAGMRNEPWPIFTEVAST